jgi:hypothetical protein
MFIVLSTGEILNLSHVRSFPCTKKTNNESKQDTVVELSNGDRFRLSEYDAQKVYDKLWKIAKCQK